jgi:TP901 family phage tail tape measure protein
MSRGFNLTAQLNLRGPTNIGTIVADIRRQLNGITANVNINLNANTARNIGQINQQLNTLNNTLRNTQNFANNASQAITNLGTAIRNLNTAANNLPANMNAINAATRNVNQNLNNVRNQTRATTSEFEEFGRQSALALRRFAAFAPVAGIFYRLTNAIASSTKEFINFDRELVRIAQVTDTSTKNLKTLEKQITTLATQYGVASNTLIQVSTTLAQAGLSAKDTEKALKALAMSALAPSFDDLNETVEGSIALMRQFNISASDLESALGSVNAVAAKFAVEASDLITAIQRTGGVFATASRGVSEGKDALNEFLAVFTSVRATTRESAETIATGLRTIFTRIQRSETIEQLTKFGVVLTDLTGKFVGPYEAVRRLSEGLNKLDPRDLKFSEIVEELGGFRQIGKVIPLIQQFAVAQQALKVAQKGQGSLAADAASAQEALAVKMSKVTEEFNALIRSIGQSQGFKDMIGMALDLASALIRIADSAKSVLPALTAIMAVRGISAATQFGTGFMRGVRRQNNGGPVREFARGGVVPGSGNGDIVPAMLEPGEFVIRKNAVSTIGAANLHKMNKYGLGGNVEAKGSILSKTYRSLSNFVDPDEIYRANVIAKPIAANDQTMIKRMIENRKNNQSLPMWKNFELALSSRFGLSLAGGNSFLDFPKKPGEAKFLKPDEGYSTDPESGFVRGNNDLTMLAKLVGSGQYKPNKAVTVYYPTSPSGMASRVMTGIKSSQAVKRKAIGGGISGPDTVPALLTPGEFVINKKAASKIGSTRLHQLNRADRIQGFNKGGSVGEVQKFAAGGFPTQLTPALGGLSPKETARLSKAIMDNVNAFNTLESMVSGLPTDQMLKAMRIFTSKLEGGATDIDRAATEAATLAQSGGGGGSRQSKKARVANSGVVIGPANPTTGIVDTRPTTNPAARGFAASQARIDQIAGNVGQYQRGQDVADRRNTPMGMSSTSNMSNAGLQFAASLKNATTPLQMLTQAAKSAGTGLLQVGKSSLSSIGRGAGGLISGIGGRALNAVGLGRLSSGGAREGGAGSGMGGMMLAMGGGLAIDSVSRSMGGEKTEQGRTVSAVGNSVLNMASTGAALGSIFGPLGTVVGGAAGAIAGWTMGLQDAKKANDEYAQSQRQATAEKKAEKSGAALSEFVSADTKGKQILGRQRFLSSFQETSEAEAAVGANVKPEKASWFGKMLGYEDETSVSAGEKRAETQKAGAQQAEQFLAQEMMLTGQTFSELKTNMKPEAFEMLTRNIAESDKTYAAYQVGMRKQIDAATDPAEKARLEAELNSQTKVMAESIARRRTAESEAAAQAKKAADASKRVAEVSIQLAQTMIKNVINSFQKMGSSIDRASNNISDAADNFNRVVEGKLIGPAVPQQLTNDIRAMKDPNAPSKERDAARTRAAAGLGATGQEALRMAKLGDSVRETGLRAANEAVGKGGTTAEQNTNMAEAVKNQLKAQIVATYGPDSDMAKSLINGVNASVNKMVEAAGEGEVLDADKLVDAAAGNLTDASKEAGELLIKQAEAIADGYDKLDKASEELINAKEQERDRVDKVNKQLKLNALALALARETDPNRILAMQIVNPIRATLEPLRQRLDGMKRDAGFQNPRNVDMMNPRAMIGLLRDRVGIARNPANDDGLRRQAAAEAKDIKDIMESTANALREAQANIYSAIEDRKKILNAEDQEKTKAQDAFAESLVTKTPQEMMDLNTTFAVLNSTLSGNIIGFNQSLDAQRAYMAALQQGKTVQEAYSDAQSAFANRNKEALSLFSQLTEMAGVKGYDLDIMKADLLENFARAQGQGLENQPLFQQILARLREDPAQRLEQAKRNDPVVQTLERWGAIMGQNARALERTLEALAAENVAAINAARNGIVDALARLQNAAPGAPAPAARSKGGPIYASDGQYINFEPRGTDTVPAMLTPGEFVINRASTQKYLPLLRRINNDNMQIAENKALNRGGVVYLQRGGMPMLNQMEDELTRAHRRAGEPARSQMGNMLSAGYRDNGTNPQVRAYYGNGNVEFEAMDRGVHVNQVHNDRRIFEHMQRYAQEWIYFRNTVQKEIFERRRRSITAQRNQHGGVIDPDIDVPFVDRMSEQQAALEAHEKLETMMFPNPRMREMSRKAGVLSPLERWQNKSVGAGGSIKPGAKNRQEVRQGRNDSIRNKGGLGMGGGTGFGFQNGGVVYASKGMMLPYAPRGSDTVPAMLTPGEFVVNRQAAQQHMGLLKQINQSKGGPIYANRGGVIYARDGVKVDNQSRANVSQESNIITIKIVNDASQNNNQSQESKGVLNTDGLKTFVEKFDSFITSLSSLQIPTKFEHSHTLDVNFTGADVLNELVREDGKLAQWVVGKVNDKFSELSRKTEGAV